jgi:hypothetical protein
VVADWHHASAGSKQRRRWCFITAFSRAVQVEIVGWEKKMGCGTQQIGTETRAEIAKGIDIAHIEHSSIFQPRFRDMALSSPSHAILRENQIGQAAREKGPPWRLMLQCGAMDQDPHFQLMA